MPILSLGLGEVMVAYGMAAAAQSLPGTASQTSAAILPRLVETPATTASRELALAALRNSPIASEALTHLAIAARQRGDRDGSRNLLRLAGLTGWHDEAAQRQIYNAALRDSDARGAARHADALLRLGLAKPELFAQFDKGIEIAGFRRALLPYFTSSPVWPREYLAGHGAQLGDAPLAELLAAVGNSGERAGLDRAIAGPLTAGLAARGRLQAAVDTWRLVRGADGMGAGTLKWSLIAVDETATPFDWQLPEAYRIDPGGGALVVDPSVVAAPAGRLLALPPGRWRLGVTGGAQAASGWRWSISCIASETFPSRSLSGDTSFVVAAQCPVQRLLLLPAAGGEPADPLPALAISRLG